MTQQEFTARTGFYPTASQFDAINAAYMNSDSDKDTFCKEWKRNGGILEYSKANAVTVSELEGKFHQIQDVLDSRIFKAFDTIDKLDTESKRRAYFCEMYQKIKAIAAEHFDNAVGVKSYKEMADTYNKFFK